MMVRTKICVLTVFAALLTPSLFSTDLDVLNATDLRAEVRPGGVDGRPFWNVCAKQFLYAPSFDFKPVSGVADYRFVVKDAKGVEHAFAAKSPQASLAPVWKEMPSGPSVVRVLANGKEIGVRSFHRAAPFAPGAYAPAKCGYVECADRALEWMFRNAWVTNWASGTIDKTYQLNCFPSKMTSATIDAMIVYAGRHPDRRERAMRIARGAADWMMAQAVKAPEAMRGLPITYCDYWEETKAMGDPWRSKEIAHAKRDQVMMIYPAYVAQAFLRLWKETKDSRYFDFAKNVADRYLGLQRADGSWAIVLQFPSGREMFGNEADATVICTFLDEVSSVTGDRRYREASDRAVPSMLRRLVSFDWEGQFEDVDVQKRPYSNLSKHIAADTMIYLLRRFPDGRYLKDAREVLRFAEDQFVIWADPAVCSWFVPGVIEQYNCAVTIDASYAKMISFYLALYAVEKNPLDLAKARALGDAITRNQQPDGLIPTVFPCDKSRMGRNWLNCMVATSRALCELEKSTF